MSSASFSTITERAITASQTGPRRGEPGALTPRSIEAADRLLRRTPAENDRVAVELLAQRYGVSFSVRSWQGVGEPSMSVQARSSTSLQDAVSLIRDMSSPATREMLEKYLAGLAVLCKRRDGDDATDEMTLVAYAAQLGAYPADVAIEALTRWPTSGEAGKWWPAWQELAALCNRLAKPRREMLHAVQWAQRNPRDLQKEAEEHEWKARYFGDHEPIKAKFHAERAAELRAEIGAKAGDQ